MSSTELSGQIRADSLVQDVVDRHPQTITVFARHGLQCVGCYISPFHTIADSAREYALAIDPLLGDLNQAVVTNAS
jgi:hybrid cluster-associated redox disulfide protein